MYDTKYAMAHIIFTLSSARNCHIFLEPSLPWSVSTLWTALNCSTKMPERSYCLCSKL